MRRWTHTQTVIAVAHHCLVGPEPTDPLQLAASGPEPVLGDLLDVAVRQLQGSLCLATGSHWEYRRWTTATQLPW
jgi:hypothetical protein